MKEMSAWSSSLLNPPRKSRACPCCFSWSNEAKKRRGDWEDQSMRRQSCQIICHQGHIRWVCIFVKLTESICSVLFKTFWGNHEFHLRRFHQEFGNLDKLMGDVSSFVLEACTTVLWCSCSDNPANHTKHCSLYLYKPGWCDISSYKLVDESTRPGVQ